MESVVKDPNHSTSQYHKHPTRSKGAATNIDKLINSVLNTDTGKLEEYRHLNLVKGWKIWTNSFANELGLLTQGIPDIEVTNCINVMYHSKGPKNKQVAYSHIVCFIRPQKAEIHRARITISRNVLDYYGSTKAPKEDLIIIKLILSRVLRTPHA